MKLFNAIEKITGTYPKTIPQARAEMTAFLRLHNAEDLLVDDDIEMMLELCSIYSDVPTQEILSNEVMDELLQEPLYKRIGSRLVPQLRITDGRVVTKIGETIHNIHSDLHFIIKKHGIAILDNTNVVFSFEQLRPVEDIINEYSGVIIFPRIRTQEDLEKLIPQNYKKSKRWAFRTIRNKYSRLEGRHFTITEMLDLITDRKIITHGNHN
jgi:hypothetical protein